MRPHRGSPRRDALRPAGESQGTTGDARSVATACPYCGVGCGLLAEVRNGRLERVSGDPAHPVNHGATCQKPLRLPDAVAAPDRATRVLRRESADERWNESAWDDTLTWLAERITGLQRRHGPDAVAFYISGQLLTEDYYAASKLVKGVLGTNNLDSNSRLCMSSAVAGYRGSLGSDGPPASYADIAQADCMLLLGSNAAACHPIVWTMVRHRQAEGAQVLVVDPRATETARAADLHLAVRPGSDLPLLNAMLNVIEREGMLDLQFADRHTSGLDEALAVAAQWTPERAAQACGITPEAIIDAARRFGTARRGLVMWSMGANQSSVGTLKNHALINLCLATGNIGRPGCGPLSLTGQPNAMGGREVGGLAQLLPGYRMSASAEDRAEMRRLWDLPAHAPGPSPRPGVAATELVEAIERGDVRAVWIVATNPVVSQPDAERFSAALRSCELVVCQDAYHPTETSALAHVLLPAAQWPEKDGTMTNSERRVSLVRKAIDAPGDALPDWEIFARVGRALGYEREFSWSSSAEVHAEYVRTTAGRLCDQSGLSHERLLREGPLQWPVPARETGDHPGTARLYGSRRFPTDDGRARIIPTPHAEPADAPDDDFPLVLTTGRIASQWHTMTRTGKSAALRDAEPRPFLELHPRDAEQAGVKDGAAVRVSSRRGEARLLARVTDDVPQGTAFAPFHWGALNLDPGWQPLNAVTSSAIDPTSKQAELKACAIRVEPLPAPVRREAALTVAVEGSENVARTGAAGLTDRRITKRRRVVVVGAGMAGMATVEAVTEQAGDAFDVTLVGTEPALPYNRILLSQLVSGEIAEPALAFHTPSWFDERGVSTLTGAQATAIDTSERTLTLGDGRLLEWDALVLATGSRPSLPPIPGIERGGVLAFRSLADARQLLAAARPGERAVVIGGGLLGLEAARGLRERGMAVSVVHLMARLMEQQLDDLAGGLLTRAMRGLGIDVHLGARTSEICGDGVVEGVRLAGGELLDAGLVVVATGTRPEVELAASAGIDVDRAIVVDDELRTSASGVWAVGECAQHRGRLYGLWAPAQAQARIAAATLTGRPGAFHGAVPATTLKVAGVDLFCAGNPVAREGEEEILALDSRNGRYRKLVLAADGSLCGAILLGDLGEARSLRELIASGAAVPDALLDWGGAPPASAAQETVCSCNAVSEQQIVHAIAERGLERVAQVAEHTGATTGCGGCRPAVQKLLDHARDERIHELRELRETTRRR